MYKRIILIFLTVVIATSVAIAGNIYDEIQDLVKQDQLNEALQLVQSERTKSQADIKLQFMEGLILTKLEDYSQAEIIFLEMIQKHPELPEPFNNLAVVYAAQGNYHEALQALQNALDKHPNYATAHENRGDIYAKMARNAYGQALKLDSNNKAVRKKLVLIHEHQAMPAESVKNAPRPSPAQSVTKQAVPDFNILEPIIPLIVKPHLGALVDNLIMQSAPNSTHSSDSLAAVSSSDSLSEAMICYTYGPIPDLQSASLLKTWFDEHDITYHARQTNKQGKQLFWLYLPPQESREAALLVLRELKKKGIGAPRLIEEGVFLNGISLGLFLQQATLDKRLMEIKGAGYAPLVEAHTGDATAHWFDVRVVASNKQLLLAGLPSQFNVAVVDCNSIAIKPSTP